MEKKTILAIVLSAAIIILGSVLNIVVFPSKKVEAPESQTTTFVEDNTGTEIDNTVEDNTVSTGDDTSERPSGVMVVEAENVIEEKETVIETELFILNFSNKGGVLTSIKLKEHQENGSDENLDLLFVGDSGESAFNMKFGGLDNNDIDNLFYIEDREIKSTGMRKLSYSRDYKDLSGDIFKLTKSYIISPNEYMIEIVIDMDKQENMNTPINISQEESDYTLYFGPQFGPSFEELNSRYEYRRYYIHDGKDKDEIKFKKTTTVSIDDRLEWAALTGKYFAVLGAYPKTSGDIKTTLLFKKERSPSNYSKLFFEASGINTSDYKGTFHFYIGPKESGELKKYNSREDNAFGLSKMNMNEIVSTGGILSPLIWLIDKGLWLFYSIIPNYGIAIILVTLLIKLLLFPLTRKSLHSTSKMQALNPQMAEIRAEYKANPQKMNLKLADLYKKEGISPLGGCLPMLLQMPIFIAFYTLFNNYFALRGAPFFGWITDLSSPETIFNLGFTIPLINMYAIRLLPILYVISQLVSARLTQAAQGNKAPLSRNMKLMQFGLPILFFFILYNAPSGLLLYWTVQSLTSGLQQLFISRRMKKKEAN